MDKDVELKFKTYPQPLKPDMLRLRSLIYEVAAEKGIGDLVECLKWGEPSYLCMQGSTLRIGWKERYPEQYALHFHCKTKLVETFKELYPNVFEYSGNRAIVFVVGGEIAVQELKHCIALSLSYHAVKHLPLLGG